MSENEGHHGKNEIIIIKRHSGNHDAHHGGAWKIAYADFMTAMMAFFLVMWLINASNPQTKAAIASYFNPVQLADEKPSEKGVKKPAKDAKGEQTQDKSKVDGTQDKTGGSAQNGTDMTATSGEETKYSDADFFENPYAVLSEIARETGKEANISPKGAGGAQTSGPATGASGGEAYRDPFDPDFWTKQVEVQNSPTGGTSPEAMAGNGPKPDAGKGEGVDLAAAQPAAGEGPKPEMSKGLSADAAAMQAAIAKADAATTDVAKADLAKADAAKMDAAKTDAAKAEAVKAAAELKGEIEKALGGAAGKLAEGLLVTPTEGGLLVTVSEEGDAPMFGVGSAVPQKDMIVAMEKIGKLLSERAGKIAIRGHTDARPFKGGESDNWRLSSERAQSAYYMLVRGGLDEKRVSQISGFADTRLQVPADPNDGANRRIEILLQSDQG